MEYTKGEWNKSNTGFARYATFGRTVTGARAFVVNSDIQIIAEAQGNTREEAEANAQLISAAPELCEALGLLLEELDMELDGEKCDHDVGICYCDTYSKMEKAQKALSKAGGK